jgi:hypothetical protein
MTTALSGKSHVLLVAAGIGVTPIAAILKTLLDHHAGFADADEELGLSGGADAASAEAEADEAEAEQQASLHGGATGGAAGGDVPAAAAAAAQRPRRHSSALRRVQRSKLRRLDVFWVNREPEAFSWFQHTLLRLEAQRAADPSLAALLHVRIFLTSFRAQADFGSQLLKLAMAHHVATGGADPLTGLRTVSEPGRPDWDAILGDARKHSGGGGAGGGAPQVLFCGPKVMAAELRQAARAHRCDFAMENF